MTQKEEHIAESGSLKDRIMAMPHDSVLFRSVKKEIQDVQELHADKDNYPLSAIIVTDSSLSISDKEFSEYMRIEKEASFPILNIVYSSTDGICYLEPAKGYDVDHVHAAKNFYGSDDKRYDTISNLQLLGYDENRSKNDMSLSEWWDGKSSTKKQNIFNPQISVPISEILICSLKTVNRCLVKF